MSEISPPSSAFAELVRAYYHAWFRYHPESAVEVGVPGYAHLLTPYRDVEKGALVCLNNELRVSLEEIDRAQLTPDQQIDRDLLYGAVLLENQYLLELDTRSPDPAKHLPIHAIYQLTIRTVDDFDDALRARLSAIPDHLAGARTQLLPRAHHIPRLWLDSAVTAARRGVDFLQALPTHPRIAQALARQLEPTITRACEALTIYGDFLERECAPQASGEFAAGEAYFSNLLHYHHFLDIEADQLYELGRRLFTETERDLKQACQAVFGHDDVAQATRQIQSDHAPATELLAVYRRQMQAAHAFVVAHDLISVPAREHLEVVETPLFMRHQIPFAAYQEPAANDPGQHGYYYVTPPKDEAELAEHNHAGLMHTCVHEAYPGHHLQFVTANLSTVASTLPRLLRPSSTLYEGWALYCEQLMHEQGFLDRPEQRFILLKDRLWRALRIMIDVEIHTRGLSIDQAADRMVAHLGFPRAQALADLNWYSRAPTVPMGYATGWALIAALRECVRAQNAQFSLKLFHDRLLSAGSIALALAVRRVFGTDLWQRVRRQVFASPAKAHAPL